MLSVSLAADFRHLVFWTVEGLVTLYRSELPDGEWGSPIYMGSQNQYLDLPPEPRSIYQRWYYRLVDSQGVEYGPETIREEPDNQANFVACTARRHIKRIGQESYLFVKRHKGTRCTECWDDVRQKRTRSNCSACGGTTYIEGWTSPIHLWASYGVDEPMPQRTQSGKLVQLQSQGWTADAPLLKIGDHIVRAWDRRVYEVLRWAPTRKGPHLLRQNIILKLVERGATQEHLANLIP